LTLRTSCIVPMSLTIPRTENTDMSTGTITSVAATSASASGVAWRKHL
jgi:hypothetical protein